MKLCILMLILWLSATAAATEPPFRVASGLFDIKDSRTLGLTTIAGEHQEIHRATEESGFRFAHHPGLIVFKDRLYCSWSNGRAHEDRPDQRVLYSSSADGKTWSSPEILAKPPEGVFGSCVAAGFHVHDDTLVAYYTLTHEYPAHNLHNEKNAVWAITWRDGANWSQPTKVAAGFYIEAPRLLSNGVLFDRAWIIRGKPTTQRFKGKGKRDGWQYPSSLVWKNSLFVAYSANKEDVAITRIALDSFDKPKRK